jgi:hypothetical protein
MTDCTELRDIMTVLPPQRIRVELRPEQALAAIRADYGLGPGTPIVSSERPNLL